MTTTDPQSLPRIETPDAADALCGRLLEATTELIALLDRETELLRAGRPQDIAALTARKSALSAGLARDTTAFARDAAFIRMAVPERLEAMTAQQETFQKSLRANQDALTAMRSVSESLLRTIAAKAGERRAAPGTYGQDASLSGAGPTRPSAIAVDRNL